MTCVKDELIVRVHQLVATRCSACSLGAAAVRNMRVLPSSTACYCNGPGALGEPEATTTGWHSTLHGPVGRVCHRRSMSGTVVVGGVTGGRCHWTSLEAGVICIITKTRPGLTLARRRVLS